MSAYNKLDGIMLGNLLDDGNYQAGVYASAYRFYDAANMTGYLFAALLLPMFGANIYDKKMLEELTGIGLRYILVSSIVVVSVIFFYGENILQFLYKDYESTFDIVLKILIVSYVAVAVAYVYGTLLVAAGKIRNLNVVFGIGLLVNVVLNLVLIPKYQAIGAAIATMITQTFVMLGQIFLVDKEMYIRMSASDLKKPLIFILISTSVFYLVKQIFLGSWIYNLAASLLFCLLLSFIFKIIEKQDFFSLKNRNE
jgi:O-antigen/teichoic acid export membrane protein